jgi:hypothetical protein
MLKSSLDKGGRSAAFRYKLLNAAAADGYESEFGGNKEAIEKDQQGNCYQSNNRGQGKA